jgi:hypothetical protein
VTKWAKEERCVAAREIETFITGAVDLFTEEGERDIYY